VVGSLLDDPFAASGKSNQEFDIFHTVLPDVPSSVYLVLNIPVVSVTKEMKYVKKGFENN